MNILIIQTAFIGDVVLATALLEQLHRCHPDAQIDFLVRRGNEGLLSGHPFCAGYWFGTRRKANMSTCCDWPGKYGTPDMTG